MGASYAWNGKEVGYGKMTVTDSTPNQNLTIRLEFTRPFESTNNYAVRADAGSRCYAPALAYDRTQQAHQQVAAAASK